MPAVMLSPTAQRLTCFPYKIHNFGRREDNQPDKTNSDKEKPEKMKLKVVIKEFAKEDNVEKEEKKLDIEKIVTEVFDVKERVNEAVEDSEGEVEVSEPYEAEIEEPVSPPPSEPNQIILVEDEEPPPESLELGSETDDKPGPARSPSVSTTHSAVSTTPPAVSTTPPNSPHPSSSCHTLLSSSPPPTSPPPPSTSPGSGVAVAGLIRSLLETDSDPVVVRWEDRSRGEFRVINPSLLAGTIQRANPARSINNLRCDRGVFESVPGKSLVFRFGSSASSSRSTPPPPSSITEEKTKTDITSVKHSPPPPAPNKRKTYAQKISDLQKPIPGQTSSYAPMQSPSPPMLLHVVPQEGGMTPLTLRIPSPSPPAPVMRGSGMPALIPLTVSDMARRDQAASQPSSKGLHLSGGRVSMEPAMEPASIPFLPFSPAPPASLEQTLQDPDIPKLEVFRSILPKVVQPEMSSRLPCLGLVSPTGSEEDELPLDLSGKATKRKADSPVDVVEVEKKVKMETKQQDSRRKAQHAEACKKYRAARKEARKGSTEQEMGEMWTFCRAALHNPDFNPRVICWESIEDGEFRIINQEEFLKTWENVRKSKLMKDGLKKRMKACDEAGTMHFRPHTRLGYRFGTMAADWRPREGELVEQGRRMVPSRMAWSSSRFHQEFHDVKQEEILSMEPPLFTVTPLCELPPLAPVEIDKPVISLTEKKQDTPEGRQETVERKPEAVERRQDAVERRQEAVEDMTECDEFDCRLILPRHRGYHAKLRLGDGLTITLDRTVFAQVEESMREALRPTEKSIKTRITSRDRSIANAVIRKGRKKPKVRSSKKLLPAEEVMEVVSGGRKMMEMDEERYSMPVLGDTLEDEYKTDRRKEEEMIEEEMKEDAKAEEDAKTKRTKTGKEIESTSPETNSRPISPEKNPISPKNTMPISPNNPEPISPKNPEPISPPSEARHRLPSVVSPRSSSTQCTPRPLVRVVPRSPVIASPDFWSG